MACYKQGALESFEPPTIMGIDEVGPMLMCALRAVTWNLRDTCAGAEMVGG